jgi:hypothetical protein
LRAEIATIFGPNVGNVVGIFQGYIFRILQHFATKLCNFTNFSMLYLAVAIYLRLIA